MRIGLWKTTSSKVGILIRKVCSITDETKPPKIALSDHTPPSATNYMTKKASIVETKTLLISWPIKTFEYGPLEKLAELIHISPGVIPQ